MRTINLLHGQRFVDWWSQGIGLSITDKVPDRISQCDITLGWHYRNGQKQYTLTRHYREKPNRYAPVENEDISSIGPFTTREDTIAALDVFERAALSGAPLAQIGVAA